MIESRELIKWLHHEEIRALPLVIQRGWAAGKCEWYAEMMQLMVFL